MSRFLNKEFIPLREYVPGEQPQDRRYIKLNTNELAYAPPKSMEQAVNDEVKRLCLYPDPTGESLKTALAQRFGLKKENVFLSNGSDEVLSFAFMSFFEDGAAFADITYGFYKVYAQLYGVKARVLPLKDDFSLDPRDYIGIGMSAVIANPNAPTGRAISAADIERILKSNSGHLVVIDEAYADFGNVSCTELIDKYDNLLIVRTYSKSLGMAGARLGYALAQPGIIADLEKIKFSVNPYNINRMTMAAGLAALSEKEYYDGCVMTVIKDRQSTAAQLEKLGFSVLPSQANFLFVRHPGLSGERYYLALKERGILVRHFSDERIKEHVRITIGTGAEMDALINATREILTEADL